MPTFLKEKFHLNLAAAGLGATFFLQMASMVGAAGAGFFADKLSQARAGGRMLTQAIGALAVRRLSFYADIRGSCGLSFSP